MKLVVLTEEELSLIKPGEVITITAVMAILVISIVVVVVYRLFQSQNGSVKIPGGWQFTWK
ncbi:MAG: hypothetical protein WCR97_01500 [Bacilli bacterium]